MPILLGNVAVLDPKPVDQAVDFDFTDILNQEVGTFPYLRTYLYAPGTPSKPRYTDNDHAGPGIPDTERHIALSYATFERFTETLPATADPPTLAPNPFIGPSPAPLIDTDSSGSGNTIGQQGNDPPGVTISFRGKRATASFLLDTGAADSFISKALAAN